MRSLFFIFLIVKIIEFSDYPLSHLSYKNEFHSTFYPQKRYQQFVTIIKRIGFLYLLHWRFTIRDLVIYLYFKPLLSSNIACNAAVVLCKLSSRICYLLAFTWLHCNFSSWCCFLFVFCCVAFIHKKFPEPFQHSLPYSILYCRPYVIVLL